MLTVIGSIRSDPRWLVSRRFAPITWSLFSAIGIAAVAPSFSWPLALFGALALLRLQVLLPHEKRWLARATQAIADARPEQAVKLLRQLPSGASVAARLKATLLQARAYIHSSDLLAAHRVLRGVDQRQLLAQEKTHLHLAWARLHLEADNLRDFHGEMGRIEPPGGDGAIEYLTLKAIAAQRCGQLAEARRLLQGAFDQPLAPAEAATLYNNLATVELAAEHPNEQLRLLRKALAEFRRTPQPMLVRSLYHNLAFALVRAGEIEAARELIREAWAQGDRTNPRHVIEVLNDSLLLARQVGDRAWVEAVYAQFEALIETLDGLPAHERVALAVSGLRMRRNDNIPLVGQNYTMHVRQMIDDLRVLDISQCVPALVEIYCDLQHEVTACAPSSGNSPSPAFSETLALLRTTAERLLALRPAVEAHLQELPRTLVGPLRQWMRYRNDLDKAEIMLADSRWEHGWGSNNPPGSTLFLDWERATPIWRRLFAHLRENAEQLEGHAANADAVHAWIVLCDEYVAYHDQLPNPHRPAWRAAYLGMAEHALDQAMRLLELPDANPRSQADHLVGVARFLLLLRNDHAAAQAWIARFDAMEMSLNQYALWFREQYGWVRERIDVLTHGAKLWA